jgi:hypothetical protein
MPYSFLNVSLMSFEEEDLPPPIRTPPVPDDYSDPPPPDETEEAVTEEIPSPDPPTADETEEAAPATGVAEEGPTISSLSAIPTLEKVIGQVDRVLAILPDLFISSADILELSKNLQTIRALVLRAKFEETSLRDLKRECADEWNVFAAALEPRVEANEEPNVSAFCETKLSFLGRVINAIGKRIDEFAKDEKATAALDRLSKAYRACADPPERELDALRRKLKNLDAEFKKGKALLVYAAQGEQLVVLENTVFQFLEAMNQFVANATRALGQRRNVRAVAAQANLAITGLFASALPFKHTQKTKSVPPTKSPEKKKWVDLGPPSHTPLVRRKLFEDPPGVRALPTRHTLT